MSSRSGIGPGSRRQRRVAALSLALMVVLAGLPALVERDPHRQALFAWEMYSKGAPRDEFLVVDSSGGERILTVADVQPRGVAPVDYTDLLPPFICRSIPEVRQVVVLRADRVIGEFSCAG